MLNDTRKKILYKALAFTFGILFISLLVATLMVNWQKTDLDKGYLDVVNEAQEIKIFIQFYDTLTIDSNSCSLMEKQLFGLADTVYLLGQKVDLYFEQNKNDPQAIDLQKQFVYMDLELWLRMVSYNKICDSNRNYILYFYPYNCTECGPLVDSIREKKTDLGDNLWVFSIPGQTDSQIVDIIMRNFKADYLPSIVVNGQTIKGPDAFKDINKYLIN